MVIMGLMKITYKLTGSEGEKKKNHKKLKGEVSSDYSRTMLVSQA